MGDTEEYRRAFITKLAQENRGFYGTADGLGALRAFELTFEHRWIYLYELVQNAVDAGAYSIALRITDDGDALIFQHDGDSPLNEKDVEGLSKVFRSTKGVSSVGFMGVGFKSVFGRFREARISGWGWSFRYEITQVVGEMYGDVQPDLLGAVIPIWDDAITAPETGFTTRFEMRRLAGSGTDLRSDLVHLLPNDDLTPLAILAASGLKRLEVDGRVWELDVSEERDESFQVTAISEDENRLWQLFPVQFEPSREAIARFLEHRRIQPSANECEEVYAEAAQPRQVLGVLPLDNDGTPAPPIRGRVYATLPTEATLPFGLHINADWLLNISRSGLREIEENPWQRDIVDRIADVLANFLGWVARTFSKPDVARAAFKALVPPSSEAVGLEELLAEDRWLSKLRTRIEGAAVLPVWTKQVGALAFVKPIEAIVPPAPLAAAFREQPDLRPAVLLKGPVLMDDVLGSDARDLLDQTNLLAEMSPQDLEQAWPEGLAMWWRTLADEQPRRRSLLFRIWAAVAELTSEEAWRNIDVPCIRTATGSWLPVGEIVFFNEPFPSEREPGGPEARQFIQPFIPDANRLPNAWINALRKGADNEGWKETSLSRALEWIEDHARSVSLQETIRNAMAALVSSAKPNWSVLRPLGHWAKHRNRADLLTHVLVESKSGSKGVPASEALLADPYVENGQDRRRLFSADPVIAAGYLEQDPKSAGAHEWRAFFERAGAKGAVKVKPLKTRASRWDNKHVAEFLGLEVDAIPESNNSGYTLLDFGIEPIPPGRSAPKELRAAFAAWIDNDFNVLKGKGKRHTSYTYYSLYNLKGNRPSTWVTMLSKLKWVPCDDGDLRLPQDVLPCSDLSREDAPVAKLSSELLSVLEQEGVKFGTAIPEATSLRRLSAVGSQLDVEELAQLLRECREQINTDDDRHHFERVAQELTVPLSDSGRVPLDRIVQRVGGRRRGTLGGWIAPLDRIDETLRMELEHADFPREFPDTTTGTQALNYLRDVWKRARSSPERLANEVRDVLPTAYAYCLEDCAKEASLSERWKAAVPEAVVFAEREWVVLAEADDIYFDDIEDRRFFPSQVQLRTATRGHLGNSRTEQLRNAEALDLQLLSSIVTMDWHQDETLSVADDWVYRFDLICELLRWVRGSERVEIDGVEIENGTGLRVIRVSNLALDVGVGSAATERVPVNARLHEGVLTVAGEPVQFGSDAAKELLRAFSFGQRGDLAADLTGMLGAIDNPSDFKLAADKFRRAFAAGFELPLMFRRETAQNTYTSEPTTEIRTDVGKSEGQASNSDDPVHDGIDQLIISQNEDSGSISGSFVKDRALATQNALARKLKSSLKGELAPSDDEASRTTGEEGEFGTDDVYRNIVAQYEREFGREPELGDPHQAGWDIRSFDPKTKRIRLIEVKGRGRPWVEDEVVELSRAQMREAFGVSNGKTTSSWYLYVVEKMKDGNYQVLPVANPIDVAAKWILCGESWRLIAEFPKCIASSK